VFGRRRLFLVGMVIFTLSLFALTYALFDAGAGLMNVPLTNAVMAATPGLRGRRRLRAAQRLA